MTTTLLIARHGNTFSKGQTPTRVGKHTDLPLVESGLQQARRLAIHLNEHDLIPDRIFTSQLLRTQQMAETINHALGTEIETTAEEMFDEVDYGPDENKPETDVIARIGQAAIDAWDKNATVPQGWKVNPNEIIEHWKAFGKVCESRYKDKTVLAITSNGIARFAPHLTGSFDAFDQDIKIATGALCALQNVNGEWNIMEWNVRP